MGIEDLFGNGRNQQRFGYDQHYEHEDQGDQSNMNRPINQQFEEKLKTINSIIVNPKFRLMLIIAAIVIVAIVILLIILLFPLILKLFKYLNENGIQGILDTIWKGTKN